MELHTLYRQDALGEDMGYVPTSEIIGYVVTDRNGIEIASGETPNEAMEQALKVVWNV